VLTGDFLTLLLARLETSFRLAGKKYASLPKDAVVPEVIPILERTFPCILTINNYLCITDKLQASRSLYAVMDKDISDILQLVQVQKNILSHMYTL
jgi:hypothetical protein